MPDDRQPTDDRPDVPAARRADHRPGSPSAPGAAPGARRPGCPRCGAPLGALAARPAADPESLYCGCCGLVLPAA